jgi:hypothetical protein
MYEKANIAMVDVEKRSSNLLMIITNYMLSARSIVTHQPLSVS